MFHILQEMKLFNLQLKKLLFCFQENPLGFFITVFSDVIILPLILTIACRCFYCRLHSPTSLFLATFSFHQFSLPPLFFVTSYFVLLYRECYRFERAFVYSQGFFTLHSLSTFGTTCFNQGFSGDGNSAQKVAGLPTEV